MDAILIPTIFSWLLQLNILMCLYLDSSATRGFLARKGVGRLRHLSCRVLWLQDLVMDKRLLVRSIMGALNPADIATKRLSAARLEFVCFFLGICIWRGNNLEGAHDPGNIFRQLSTQRQQQGQNHVQINLLISALSLLTQLQGCAGAMELAEADSNFGFVVVLPWLVGLMGYLYVALRPGQRQGSFDFVTAEDKPEHIDSEVKNESESDGVSEISEPPPFSSAGLIQWMYGRCDRRLHKAVMAKYPLKVSQYQARQGLLSDMLAFLETATEDENERMENMLQEIGDLSSDEDSPAMNTGGHRRNLPTGTSSRLASAFVYGAAVYQLCGCDSGTNSCRPDDIWHLFRTYGFDSLDSWFGGHGIGFVSQSGWRTSLKLRRKMLRFDKVVVDRTLKLRKVHLWRALCCSLFRATWQQWQEVEVLSTSYMVAQLHLSLSKQLSGRTSKDSGGGGNKRHER